MAGVFCGPLRLLALEVHEELNDDGVYCSLMTGQERKDVPFASHLSCTIEMLNIRKVGDVYAHGRFALYISYANLVHRKSPSPSLVFTSTLRALTWRSLTRFR